VAASFPSFQQPLWNIIMAVESKWTERFWSVVTLLAAVAGGGACVKVMIGSDPAPTQTRPAPAIAAPCDPPMKTTCGTPARW
jgi:hypothetical protein